MSHHRQPAAPPGPVRVFTVEVLLERRDGSRAHDQKWVLATRPDEAGERGLASAADRWPGHTIVGITSVRVDHSLRARRFLRRAARHPSPPSTERAEGAAGVRVDYSPARVASTR